jgi:hypothetical protein
MQDNDKARERTMTRRQRTMWHGKCAQPNTDTTQQCERLQRTRLWHDFDFCLFVCFVREHCRHMQVSCGWQSKAGEDQGHIRNDVRPLWTPEAKSKRLPRVSKQDLARKECREGQGHTHSKRHVPPSLDELTSNSPINLLCVRTNRRPQASSVSCTLYSWIIGFKLVA